VRVCAGKHRLVQVAKTGARKLFDKARREVFLEWFAATCNVRLSAAKAGVHEKTVFRHRMKDEAFAEAWDRALQQGYARLEARLLQEVHAPCFGQSGSLPEDEKDSRSTSLRTNGSIEVRGDFDDPAVEEQFDPQLAILLLREHARRLPGSADKRKAQRTTARAADSKEIAEALAKRLKGFALRQQIPPRDGEVAAAPAADGGGPLHHAPHGPPPRSGEE
jgi:hypothetical protein